jgi:ubiquinone/menaquinone biosynthesis C-methylase UbiE
MDEKEIKRNISGIFSRAASTYDQVGFRFFYYFGKRIVELMDIQKNDKILDVASGRGAILFPAVNKVGPHGSVIGIDIAEGMVQKTTEEIKKYEYSNAKMLQMDAENLEFQDNSFDIILYGLCIFFFPQYEIALNESFRVLKPNGRIGISTFCRTTYEVNVWIYELVEQYLPKNKREKQHEEEDNDYSIFETIEGMQKVLTKAGYKEIYNKVEEKNFVCPNAEELWKFLWSAGYRRALEQIDSENLEKLKDEILTNFQKYKGQDGLNWNIKVLFTFGRK